MPYREPLLAVQDSSLTSIPYSKKRVTSPYDLSTLKIAVTAGVMNRANHLCEALATWRRLPYVSAIYAVDWGSREPLRDVLGGVLASDRRLVVVRAEQPSWQNARCHNLELQLVSDYDWHLRLDADTLVSDCFFDAHPVEPNMFYAGNWRFAQGQNKSGLTGTVYARPADVLRVNGYNERLTSYGREDDDLYDRLRASGLRRMDVDLGTMDHIPHDDCFRVENLAEEFRGRDVNSLISRSCEVEVCRRWTLDDQMTRWHVVKVERNYWVCEAAP